MAMIERYRIGHRNDGDVLNSVGKVSSCRKRMAGDTADFVSEAPDRPIGRSVALYNEWGNICMVEALAFLHRRRLLHDTFELVTQRRRQRVI